MASHSGYCSMCGRYAQRLLRFRRCADCRDLAVARAAEESALRWVEKSCGKAGQLRKYGLTVEQYDAMLAAQDGRCAICRQPPAPHLSMRELLLFVDHDHTTQSVRGLLCHRCNSGLGIFYDDPRLLRRAIAYLAAAKRAVGEAAS